MSLRGRSRLLSGVSSGQQLAEQPRVSAASAVEVTAVLPVPLAGGRFPPPALP